jgi:hypothetical protein
MTLKLNGSTAGSVSIDAPADTSPTGTDVTLTLPTSAGSSGQYLQTNGSGTLSWQTVEGLPDAIDVNASAPADSVNINSAGKFLVGTSTARTTFFNDSIAPHVQIEGYDEATSSLSIYSNENNSNGPYLFLGKGRGGSVGSTTQVSNGDRLGSLQFAGLDQQAHVMCAAEICAEVDGTPAQSGEDMPGRLTFFTMPNGSGTNVPTERMRITNGGFIKVSNSGSYPDGTGDNTGHYFNHNRTLEPVLFIRADSGSYGETGVGALKVLVNRNTTNNSFNIASFTNGNGTGKCLIRDNGDLENTNNSYTGISDVKLKENIVDANSQWDDIKALEFKTYNLIAKPDERHIGVIAQQVEEVSPGLVRDTKDFDADGNDLGTVTKSVKYSILYTKAVKALQEAMERIETLETANASQAATIAALDARLTALEGGAS